jgi:hypothetical protein
VDSPLPARKQARDMSPGKCRSKAENIISEMLSSGEIQAAASDIADNFNERTMAFALEAAINKALESSQKCRFLVGQVLVDLIKHQRVAHVKELVTAYVHCHVLVLHSLITPSSSSDSQC